jgi:hypothetical protein
MTGRNNRMDDLVITKIKRDTTSPTTIVAQNMALVNQANLADFLEGLETSDIYEPNFKRVTLDIESYNSGPYRIRIFLGESLEGAGLVDYNGLDTTEDLMFDGAYSLEPFEVLPLSPWINAKCIGSSVWTVNRHFDITKPVKRWYNHAAAFEGDSNEWTNLNVLVMTNQAASVGSDVHSWITVEYTRSRNNPILSLIPTHER